MVLDVIQSYKWLVVAIVAILYLSFLLSNRTPGTKRFNKSIFKKYEAHSSIFINKNELIFFKILRKKLGSKYLVMSKVRLEDIIKPKSGLKNKEYWALRGRVKSRHVDYLITNSEGRPVLVLELDGSAHSLKKAGRSDKFKDLLFAMTGVPFGRVSVGQNYNEAVDGFITQFRL